MSTSRYALQAHAPFMHPQLATLVSSVPPGNEWLHELKFDGYRILCRVENGGASFLTREAQDWTHRFSALVKLAEELSPHQLFFDGEIVAMDANGVNDFRLLQNSLRQNSSANFGLLRRKYPLNECRKKIDCTEG